MKKFASLLTVLAFSATAFATAQFKITEVYAGVTGEDGTEDWIEVTNVGDMMGSTDGLIYDDESLDPAAGGPLPAFDLNPGESAVFLVSADDTTQAVVDFVTIWGQPANIGATTGGGGLSQNGDTAAILLGDGTVVDSAPFTGDLGGDLATIDFVGTPFISQIGVNGAYESNMFFNDNIGGDDDMISLVGSPGIVPEPASLSLLVLGALGLIRRR